MTTTETYVSIDDLSVTLHDGVLSVTMNRPNSLNSLTAAMLTTIADTLKQAASDPRVKVVPRARRVERTIVIHKRRVDQRTSVRSAA